MGEICYITVRILEQPLRISLKLCTAPRDNKTTKNIYHIQMWRHLWDDQITKQLAPSCFCENLCTSNPYVLLVHTLFWKEKNPCTMNTYGFEVHRFAQSHLNFTALFNILLFYGLILYAFSCTLSVFPCTWCIILYLVYILSCTYSPSQINGFLTKCCPIFRMKCQK